MLHRSLFVALLAAPVLAQSNAVPGLDIRMWELTDIAFQGRRGPAFPNGEAGFMVGHSWCNSGSVNLPWQSEINGVMVDQYPRICWLLARESGGRMVQVSGRSFAKHSPTAFNFSNGPCAPCTAGGGPFFFVGCSDTYGSGINSSQYALGPTEELNPWLGTWNPQGSYFDRGDPAVTGAAAIDSVRSLTFGQVQAFDSVKNKMIVRESELVAGATYFSQVQAVVQGEPVTARGNNIINRGVTISGTGGAWNAVATGAQASGSVLTRWQGAFSDIGGNGNDDGRFVVAVKVTGPVAGMWHYEYAIHNVDNMRGGASFRVPVAPGGVVQNAGFRDLDTDPLNDWTMSTSATEVAFTAVGTNSLDWNTIYNCWFDCSVPPGAGAMTIDQARPGAGALAVQVTSEVPSGLAFANKFSVGAPCGTCASSFYELFASAAAFDLAGRSMTMTLNGGAYSVAGPTVAYVPPAGVNLGLAFNGQTQVTLPFTLPYPGGSTTQLRVCASGYVWPGAAAPSQAVPQVSTFLSSGPRWAAAWMALAPAVGTANNVFFDANPSRAILSWSGVPVIGNTQPSNFQIQFFPSGQVNVVWQNLAPSTFAVLTGWSSGGTQVDPGSRDLSSTLSTPLALCPTPFAGLTLDASARPVLGTTVQWQLGGFPAGTGWGALMRSLTQAVPPVDLTSAGMPGCFAHVVAPEATLFLSPGAALQLPEQIPTSLSLIGVTLVGQAVAYQPSLTPLGLVASNATVLTLGL